MAALSFREAGPADAGSVAALHADSWRRFYRGAYADEYLDGDVEADRLAVWSQRLETPGSDGVTILAEAEGALAGFVHVVLDEDARWGSLLDNLHVSQGRQRSGIGAALLALAARAVLERGRTGSMYLWVLEQNAAARAFYAAQGGTFAERALAEPPGGVPGRLNGRPVKLRIVWPEVRTLLSPGAS